MFAADAIRCMRRCNDGGGGIPPSAQIGDYIAGGVYAGVYSQGGVNAHLIMSLQDATVYGIPWGGYGLLIGCSSQYDGLSNQNIALSSPYESQLLAIQHCANYQDSLGNGDYYLPSRYEALHIQAALVSHPEFSDLVYPRFVFTSSETNDNYVYAVRGDGYNHALQGSKGATNKYIRPIRRVDV